MLIFYKANCKNEMGGGFKQEMFFVKIRKTEN